VCSHLTQSCDTVSIQVVTGDSDLYQLESQPNVTLWDRKGARWRDRLKQVDPGHYISAKCYAGDSADGIPSVGSRIGLKTALGWVTGSKAWPKDATRINRDRLELNRKLILFSHIPNEIQQAIQAIITQNDTQEPHK
jgi:5'-3' exonuclease